MAIHEKASRARGRPKGSGDLQRNRLLQAAQGLLISSGSDMTLRQVALQAGVTAPLAHYYFGNRDGLLQALIDERAGPRVDELLSIAQERALQPVAALTRLMQRLTLLVASDALVRRCLFLSAGAGLRARLRLTFHTLLEAAQAAGQLRVDLSASYLADALLSLCLYPHLDTDSTRDDSARAAALTLQHVALLQDGIRGRNTGVSG